MSGQGGATGAAADVGALLLELDGLEVRESFAAGAYYCAHTLWTVSAWARAPHSSVRADRHGDPLVGFLHVPSDVETAGHPSPRPALERHGTTIRVLAGALRGWLEELTGVRDKRVLVTGFGPFAAVASNPTGELVSSDAVAARLAVLATGCAPKLQCRGDAGERTLVVDEVEGLELVRLVLPVDDSALDADTVGSLPWALSTYAPHAVIALGVHRTASRYHVELQPTDAGLLLEGGPPRHQAERVAERVAPVNRSLARAIVRGVAATVVPSDAV